VSLYLSFCLLKSLTYLCTQDVARCQNLAGIFSQDIVDLQLAANSIIQAMTLILVLPRAMLQTMLLPVWLFPGLLALAVPQAPSQVAPVLTMLMIVFLTMEALPPKHGKKITGSGPIFFCLQRNGVHSNSFHG
jgi:hypothetical protein